MYLEEVKPFGQDESLLASNLLIETRQCPSMGLNAEVRNDPRARDEVVHEVTELPEADGTTVLTRLLDREPRLGELTLVAREVIREAVHVTGEGLHFTHVFLGNHIGIIGKNHLQFDLGPLGFLDLAASLVNLGSRGRIGAGIAIVQYTVVIAVTVLTDASRLRRTGS